MNLMMKKILVIEDNPDNMALVTFLLEKGGFTPIQAATGAKGLELAKKEKPHCILLDIQLPDTNGEEVLRVIRQTDDSTPIIAVTSYAMSGDRERLLAAGCSGYLEKPIDPYSFIDQLTEIIGGL